MVAYVEWALPRARKLGTRVSKAEARAIGWVHGFYRLQREEDAAALAAQRKAARAEHAALRQEAEAALYNVDDTLLPGLATTEEHGND